MSKPQVNLNIDGLMLIGIGVGVPLLGFIGYKLYGAKEAIAGAVDKVNPASQNNFVNQGVESVGQALTGDSNWTLGGWAYEWSHNDDTTVDAAGMGWDIAGLIGKLQLPGITPAVQAASAAKKVEPYVNPANPNNLINQAVTGAVGDKNMAAAGDYFFGAIDLLNPFNESDEYAQKVWGIEK